RSLLFREEEGSFLAGYVAGAASKTGKIGFVGGMDLPLIRKFQYGYEAGALYANPKIVCLPAKFTGDWVNIDLGKTSANSLYGDGADVVYAAA
ncbi:BMP family ABC transporter substrate-binding protein, partial [Acinetobacter baumannii]